MHSHHLVCIPRPKDTKRIEETTMRLAKVAEEFSGGRKKLPQGIKKA